MLLPGFLEKFVGPGGVVSIPLLPIDTISHDALQMRLRLVLLSVTTASYGTQAILRQK
jgi:hypothetical protein